MGAGASTISNDGPHCQKNVLCCSGADALSTTTERPERTSWLSGSIHSDQRSSARSAITTRCSPSASWGRIVARQMRSASRPVQTSRRSTPGLSRVARSSSGSAGARQARTTAPIAKSAAIETLTVGKRGLRNPRNASSSAGTISTRSCQDASAGVRSTRLPRAPPMTSPNPTRSSVGRGRRSTHNTPAVTRIAATPNTGPASPNSEKAAPGFSW